MKENACCLICDPNFVNTLLVPQMSKEKYHGINMDVI